LCHAQSRRYAQLLANSEARTKLSEGA